MYIYIHTYIYIYIYAYIHKYTGIFDREGHQEIKRVILCHLIYMIMSFKPFNDIIMIVCKFLIGLCCLRSYST